MTTMAPQLKLAICDDHPLFRAGLVGLLRGEGIDVVIEAGTIAELVGALAGARLDLVIVDIDLPDGNGIDAIANVDSRCPTMVLSALDDPGLVQRAFRNGARAFVRKDATPAVLLKSIRDAAAGKTVLPAEVAVRLAESLRTEPKEREFARLVDQLTARQRAVLALLAEGKSNKEVGAALFVSEGTIKNHVTQILRTFGVGDRTRLAILLARYGISS